MGKVVFTKEVFDDEGNIVSRQQETTCTETFAKDDCDCECGFDCDCNDLEYEWELEESVVDKVAKIAKRVGIIATAAGIALIATKLIRGARR